MKLQKFNPGWLVPIAAVAVGMLIFLYDPLPLQVLRNSVFDQYQRWAPRNYKPDVPVHIIDIDEASLAKLGQWPWPRTRIAELVRRLQDAGAAAIVFDVLFAEPDRTSPSSMVRLWHLDPQQRAMLDELPDNDAVFARAIARGGVVLGHAPTRGGQIPTTFVQPYRVIDLGPSPLPFLHTFKGTVAALPSLQKAAAGNGAITFVPDSDGVVRRVPILFRLGDQVVPSLVAEALRVAQNEQNYFVKTSAEAGAGVEEVRIGALTVPTTAQGEVWVHYTRPEAGRYIPAWKVLAGQVPESSIRNQILLVGSSAQGLMDLRFSPLGGTIPGVEAHAQALEQILSGDPLARPNWATGLEAVELVAGGLFVGFVGISVGALLSAAAAITVLLATFVWAWYGYSDHGLLLDPVLPSLSTLLIFIISSVYHHTASEYRQRWVKRAFSRYVSPNLVSHLVDNPGQLELGGRRRECSFIFTDLAGFTNLMEKLDPSVAVSLLNDYLDNMVKIAFKHEGTLDRIVGDAVAIMFSAPVEQPDHRQRAIDCAREMHRFAKGYAAEANGRGVPFGQTRIGIHTGEVTVGNFGGSTIFDYRALGDPVNTAARLESVNKQLGTIVCVSEATLAGCPGVLARPVGRLVLKGKTEPLMVYEPAFAEEGGDQVDPDYEAAYRKMAEGETETAVAAFEQLAAARPHDPLPAFHLARLRRGQTGDLIVFTEK